MLRDRVLLGAIARPHIRFKAVEMKNRMICVVCALGLLLCASAQHANAQQNVTSASLSGEVEDVNGARVAGATVTATQLETNQRRATNSDRDGRFRFPYLPVGSYRVTVDAPGFATVPQEVTLTVGQTLSLSIKLNVSGVVESVAVNDVPAIETVRTQVSETIRPAEINQLPLNGRNYLDLALLVPAVSPTNTGSNQRFAETSAVPGQGISFGGQRNLYNSFIVDGLSANDDAADLTGTYFSQEVIREFQVVTSGGIAEFGRASGGVVNIVTKSGTNELRGNLYGFFRNQRFDARNPLAPTKDLLTQAQYGGTAGGRVPRQFRHHEFLRAHRSSHQRAQSAQRALQSLPHRSRELAQRRRTERGQPWFGIE